MKQLWAPWRLEYIRGEKPAGCIFCDAAAGADEAESLVVARSPRAFVILNLFPYNSGHVMVVPSRHLARLADLDDAELLDLTRLVDRTLRVLEHVLRPEGYNVGLNLGRAAGAGVEDHLHVHVVPRWIGDTNFMPVLSETKVLPEHLKTTRARLTEGFAALTAQER